MNFFAAFFLLLVVPLSTVARAQLCRTQLAGASIKSKVIEKVCPALRQREVCKSVEGRPIYHFEKRGTSGNGKRILALALIHGDEKPSSSVAVSWIERLQRIDSRNTWRVLPIVSPDGLHLGTRTNAKGVDLNRNFPTKLWKDLAIKEWKRKKKSDPRRYPGPSPASEPETKCLLSHINDYKPDFIISIHTPLGLLDFDGPRIGAPRFTPLPWTSLGNFPGSLGRYMWKDNKVPVLTIELRGNKGLKSLEKFDQLQDISGTVAIQSARFRTPRKKSPKKGIKQ